MKHSEGGLILITSPDLEYYWGISNYVRILDKKLNQDHKIFIRGHRKKDKHLIARLFTAVIDDFKFLSTLLTNKITLVHFNTSLTVTSLYRDFIFIILAKLFKKKILVYFHGWHQECRKILYNGKLNYLLKVFLSADLIIVLAEEFRRDLLNWGYKKKVIVEKNLIDESELALISPEIIYLKISLPDKIFKILFISRIEKDKGIFETLEAFQLFNSIYPRSELVIAGEGSQKSYVEHLVKKKNLQNKVKVKGLITGVEKSECFLDSDILIFPTYHGEGMPMNIIEAMSFGLPIITRPVGGIKDFFKEGQMGTLVESLSPTAFFKALEAFYLDKELRKRAALTNYNFSMENFYSKVVLQRFNQIYESLLA